MCLDANKDDLIGLVFPKPRQRFRRRHREKKLVKARGIFGEHGGYTGDRVAESRLVLSGDQDGQGQYFDCRI